MCIVVKGVGLCGSQSKGRKVIALEPVGWWFWRMMFSRWVGWVVRVHAPVAYI